MTDAQVVFHGTLDETYLFTGAIDRNCVKGPNGCCVGAACGAHRLAIESQAAVDRLLALHRDARRLLNEEWA